MTLRRKLLLSLLLTLLPLLALGLTAYVLVRDSLIDDATQQVELRAGLRAEEVARRLDVAHGELEAISMWPDLAEPALSVAGGDATGASLAEPLSAVATWWAEFRELAVVTRSGEVLAATDDDYAARVRLADVRGPATGTPENVDGRWLMTISRPMGSGDDVFVAGEIASEFLVAGGLVAADADDISTAGALLAEGERRRVLVFVADHDSAAEAASVARALSMGDPELTGVRAVAGSRLFVGVSADEDEVLQPLGRLRWAIIVALLMAGAVIAVLATVLGRTITSRLGRLRDVTAAIGGGDLSRRTGDHGDDEIGVLSAEFDKMAEQLASDNLLRSQIQDELSHQALHDSLTGLANRVKFLDRLQDALARSSRSGAPVAVLFCDLDNLKTVNDELGHQAGDDLITGVADRFRNSVRPSDTVARFGGDEFVVLCAEMAAPEDALVVADRLSAALVQPFDIASEAITATASIGIAVGTGATATADELVRDADEAMYEAKDGGKARYVVHSDSLQDRARRKQARVEEALVALRDDQLRLEFQPVVELETGRVVHFETFVRWDHPDRGVVAPGELLSQFTEAGAARQLDEWVLGHALSQLEAWNRSRSGEARPVLTVNLTRASVQDPGLVASIRALLVDHAVDPCQLLIEVAEPNLSDDPGAATATLDEARRLGLTLVVDDFGTGHTSIERLQRFGFGVMKIDGSLVDELDRDGDRTGFVAALSLAAALDMTAVAEGVERVEQVQALLHHGCMYAQGHLFCAPVGADRLGSWLDRLEM